jgi:NAD dependent epimerase/dehydratase family
VKLVDGTTVSMPDTEENQARFPQHSGQEPGVGFPLARILGVMSLSNGALLNAAIGPFKGKGTGEYGLFRSLQESFVAGDIVLGDRYFCSYFLIADMLKRGVDVLFEQHGARNTDFRRGAQLGVRYHRVSWSKPILKPEWMTVQEYQSHPDQIGVREVKVGKKVLITTFLVPRKTHKKRWIYSCVKQLLDRIIWAYGQQGLQFTLFRPFNWIGSGLDSMDDPKEGSSRMLTQFLGHIVRGEPIKLVDGGSQTRAFTFIDDAVECLATIIDNPNGIADGKIYNIGNPHNSYSIRELANMMLEIAMARPEYAPTARNTKLIDISALDYYGKGYADIPARLPLIKNTTTELGWTPTTDMRSALKAIFDSYAHALPSASALLSTDA